MSVYIKTRVVNIPVLIDAGVSVSLINGKFLEGLNIPDLPEFQSWRSGSVRGVDDSEIRVLGICPVEIEVDLQLRMADC